MPARRQRGRRTGIVAKRWRGEAGSSTETKTATAVDAKLTAAQQAAKAASERADAAQLEAAIKQAVAEFAAGHTCPTST